MTLKWLVSFFGFLLLATGCEPTSMDNSRSTAISQAEKTDKIDVKEKTWKLDDSSSRIAFASIKAHEFIETHYFSRLSGQISGNGEAIVTIFLKDVETRIDIRNERMRDMFFEINKFPRATIKANVNVNDFSDLPIGGRREAEIEATLSLHGKESSVFANAFVTRIAKTRVEVATTEPTIVYVSDFDLETGLDSLREIANLPSITGVVPVTFSLVFDLQK